MRYARMAAAFLGVMILAGCGEVITDGDVYNKEFVPQHDIVVDDSTTIEVGDISVPIISSHTETVPDRFYIDFRKRDEKSGDWITRRIEVDRDTYNRFQEGDPFSVK